LKQIFTPAVGFQPERNDLQLYAMKMAVACLFRESRENPVRADLVNDPDEWRYSGEIVVIDRA